MDSVLKRGNPIKTKLLPVGKETKKIERLLCIPTNHIYKMHHSSLSSCFLLLVFLLFGGSAESQDVDVTPARDLLQRLLGNRSSEFKLVYDKSIGLYDTFQLESWDKGVLITGSSIPGLTMGIYYYLKYFCNAQVSWFANQLFIPTPLPRVTTPVLVTSNDPYRYYQNVCTVSYSMVWWNWARWEREIDWMALNGVTLPLAFTGQEAIWYRVYKNIGFTDDEINAYFTGPAFLAWNRMGNVQGFGGPLSPSWHNKRVQLQHQILDRMRSLGMTPVLPAFAGRVLPAFKRIFPNASVLTDSTHWGHFSPPYCCTSFLEPTDPLFVKIGTAFLTEYIWEFGTNHIYNADLFNELQPPTSDPKYLARCGRAVYESQISADNEATWLMQGWLFVNNPTFWKEEQARALLTSVPLGRLIVLDLESELHPVYEQLKFFFGQPFIWNMLHNYGGVTGLYGAMDLVNQGPFKCRNATKFTKNLVGTGLTPEGIEQNEVMFELMNEMAWRKEPVDLDLWLRNFTIRRYGKTSETVISAWNLLKRSVYNANPSYKNHGQYIMMLRPSLKRVPYIWYDPSNITAAWKLFVNASQDKDLQKQETFKYDMVDLGRQVMQLAFAEYYGTAILAYNLGNLDLLKSTASEILKLLDDLESLLNTSSHFMLGPWVESAKEWADSPEEARLFEFNARNQISLWGPTGEIMDYANKQWSGVISGYIKPRWELFLTTLENCVILRKPFNQSEFSTKVLVLVEEPFSYNTTTLPTNPTGDPFIVSKSLLANYRNTIENFVHVQAPERLMRAWGKVQLKTVPDVDLSWTWAKPGMKLVFKENP